LRRDLRIAPEAIGRFARRPGFTRLGHPAFGSGAPRTPQHPEPFRQPLLPQIRH
jgi:hypothetical protein